MGTPWSSNVQIVVGASGLDGQLPTPAPAPMPAPTVDQPRPARPRIVGVDVARLIALIGMMVTHIVPGIVDGAVTVPQLVFGGRSSAMFAVLAGVSLALVSGRGTPLTGPTLRAARVGVATRAVLIAAIGLVLGQFDSGVAVILVNYGLLFLLAVPFLGLGPRALAWWAAGWAVVSPVVGQLVRPLLPATTGINPNLASLAQPWQLVTELTFTGYYPTVQWLTYILVGLAVGRLALTRTRCALWLLGVGTVMAVVAWTTARLLVREVIGLAHLQAALPPESSLGRMPIELALDHGFYGTTPTTTWGWLTVSAPHTGTTFDLVHTTGCALGLLGLLLLICRGLPRGVELLFGAGAMTLTLYSSHVVALGLGIGPERPALLAWHVALIVLFGWVWRSTIGKGPLEWVVGSASKATARLVTGQGP